MGGAGAAAGTRAGTKAGSERIIRVEESEVFGLRSKEAQKAGRRHRRAQRGHPELLWKASESALSDMKSCN